jgi:type II secretory pathway component GspD/PulD (secretin)
VLIISDIASNMDKLRKVIVKIDAEPQQIIIETKILEVNIDKLKDIGFDWGTGTGGASETDITSLPYSTINGTTQSQVGGHMQSSQVTPAAFGAKSSTIGGNITTSMFNTGLALLYQKVTGDQFSVLLHALEEDASTNTLSAPRVIALTNQEASILVGTRFPILKQDTTSSSSSATVTTVSLDYYQDIGIQLNVVPQVGADNTINMVVHPAVTSYTQTLGGTGVAQYPIIETREAETRILMNDGETVIIGGLLKDIKSKSRQGIPFLGQIPILGLLFSRDTVDTQKVDLLICISARIIKDHSEEVREVALMEKSFKEPAKKKKRLQDAAKQEAKDAAKQEAKKAAKK